jgi:hypothetical protein
MLREAVYFLAAVFATITLFFVLVPVWSSFYTAMVPDIKSLISDTTFSNMFNTLPSNLNIILQYSFIVILIGLGIYIALVPFRREPTSYYE